MVGLVGSGTATQCLSLVRSVSPVFSVSRWHFLISIINYFHTKIKSMIENCKHFRKKWPSLKDHFQFQMKRSYFRKEELPFAILWPTNAAVKGGSLQGLKIVFNWGCLLYWTCLSFNWMGHSSDNEFHWNWIEWAFSHMIWTTSFRITHAGLTCEQIITQVRISSTSTNNGTNNCDVQNPTYYKVGGVELVKEEALTRATTSNRSDQHLQLKMEST